MIDQSQALKLHPLSYLVQELFWHLKWVRQLICLDKTSGKLSMVGLIWQNSKTPKKC